MQTSIAVLRLRRASTSAIHSLALPLAIATMTALTSSCRHPPPRPTSNAVPRGPQLTSGVFHFSPRQEDSRQGPVGVGSARCELYVYPWANSGECRVQLNHCGLSAGSQTELLCLSLADEHTVRCGQQFNACGQMVQCDCPAGEALPVEEAPGTVHVNPQQRDVILRSENGLCEARSGLPSWAANAPPPPPCYFSIHECEQPGDAGCIDRNEMLSCTVRATICSRPVKCECPNEGTMQRTIGH